HRGDQGQWGDPAARHEGPQQPDRHDGDGDDPGQVGIGDLADVIERRCLPGDAGGGGVDGPGGRRGGGADGLDGVEGRVAAGVAGGQADGVLHGGAVGADVGGGGAVGLVGGGGDGGARRRDGGERPGRAERSVQRGAL